MNRDDMLEYHSSTNASRRVFAPRQGEAAAGCCWWMYYSCSFLLDICRGAAVYCHQPLSAFVVVVVGRPGVLWKVAGPLCCRGDGLDL